MAGNRHQQPSRARLRRWAEFNDDAQKASFQMTPATAVATMPTVTMSPPSVSCGPVRAKANVMIPMGSRLTPTTIIRTTTAVMQPRVDSR